MNNEKKPEQDLKFNFQVSKKNFYKNISFGVLANIVNYAASLIIVMYVTRILQPAFYGKLSFASTVVGYFVLFANLGMPIYAVRACASNRDDREKLNNVFSELFTLGIFLSLVSFGILSVLCFTVPVFADNRNLILLLGAAILFNPIDCTWLYKGLEKFKYLAIVSIFAKILSLIGVFAFVNSPKDTFVYAVISISVSFSSSLLNFILLRKFVDVKIGKKINFKILKPVIIFFMMSCAVSIYGNLDIAMLRVMKDEYETGLYAVVSKAKAFLAFFGGIVWNAALPMSVNAWNKKDKSNFEKSVQKSISLVTLVNVSLLVYTFVFADKIVFLLGGSEYLSIVTAFRITVLSLLPIGLSNILGGQVLIPTGNERKLLLAEIAGAVSNFALNLVIIPQLSGVGAAATTLFAEALVWIVCLHYCKKETGLKISTMLPPKILICITSAMLSGAITFGIYNAVCNVLFNASYKDPSTWNVTNEIAIIIATGFIFYAFYIVIAGLLHENFSRKILRIIKNKTQRIYYKIRSTTLKKNPSSVYCPCCNLYFKTFVNGGFKERTTLYNPVRYMEFNQNVICPFCHSLPRHRILVSWMERNLNLIKERNILYFARENSINLFLSRNKIKSVSADLFHEADLKLDLTNIDLPDNSQQMIVCNHVLEHVGSYQKALSELHRILAQDGILILSFPVDNKLETIIEDDTVITPEDRIKHFGQHDHLRVFGRDSKQILEKAGFEVDTIDGNDYDKKIVPEIGPADYDSNVLFLLKRKKIFKQ